MSGNIIFPMEFPYTQNRKFHLSFLSSELPLTITSGGFLRQQRRVLCFCLDRLLADSVSLTTVA